MPSLPVAGIGQPLLSRIISYVIPPSYDTHQILSSFIFRYGVTPSTPSFPFIPSLPSFPEVTVIEELSENVINHPPEFSPFKAVTLLIIFPELYASSNADIEALICAISDRISLKSSSYILHAERLKIEIIAKYNNLFLQLIMLFMLRYVAPSTPNVPYAWVI